MEKIELKKSESSGHVIRWFPSLQEGWVEGYKLDVQNIGCNIIERNDIILEIKLYDQDKIIYSDKKQGSMELFYDYAGDNETYGNRKIYPQESMPVKDSRVPLSEANMCVPFGYGIRRFEIPKYFKFNKSGNYPVKF